MKRIEDHLPDLVVGAPVSADVFVQTGYATFDTSALMNKLAEYWMPEIALALDRANVRAWVSADLLAELKAKAKDRHLGNEKRSCAKKAYMFIERMLRNDQLKVFSEMTEMPTGEDDDIRESSGRPPFLDNVIAARIRLYSQEVPSAVLSCDKNLARTLLMPQYQPYECSERSFLVQVFTLTPDGICPWTIEEPEPAEEDALEGYHPLRGGGGGRRRRRYLRAASAAVRRDDAAGRGTEPGRHL